MSLRERRDIVDLCASGSAATGAALLSGVLFTVVQVAGSSYRQPGARMIAMADGRTAGTLSGGCLEGDLLHRAAWTVRQGAVVEHFSTAFDDTADVPYGLGCGGEIDVLAESLDTTEAAALLEAMAATLQGSSSRTVATLLAGTGSAGHGGSLQRIVLDPSGDVLFASESLPTEDIVTLRQAVSGVDAPCVWTALPMGQVFVERLGPVQRLVIFGAGEDARPLARLAAELGWQPVVVDTRSRRLQPARFPGATCVQAGTAAAVPVHPADAVVLMTHSYAQDRDLLGELLTMDVVYLGLLGARHRSALLLMEASAAASVPLHTAVEQVHAPVGLDLGGEGPEAVALSIVAEVQHVLTHGKGQSTRRLNPADVDRLVAASPVATYSQCSLGQDATAEEPVTQ